MRKKKVFMKKNSNIFFCWSTVPTNLPAVSYCVLQQALLLQSCLHFSFSLSPLKAAGISSKLLSFREWHCPLPAQRKRDVESEEEVDRSSLTPLLTNAAVFRMAAGNTTQSQLWELAQMTEQLSMGDFELRLHIALPGQTFLSPPNKPSVELSQQTDKKTFLFLIPAVANKVKIRSGSIDPVLPFVIFPLDRS